MGTCVHENALEVEECSNGCPPKDTHKTPKDPRSVPKVRPGPPKREPKGKLGRIRKGVCECLEIKKI